MNPKPEAEPDNEHEENNDNEDYDDEHDEVKEVEPPEEETAYLISIESKDKEVDKEEVIDEEEEDQVGEYSRG